MWKKSLNFLSHKWHYFENPQALIVKQIKTLMDAPHPPVHQVAPHIA